MEDVNPRYWEEYSNLQFIKHKMIKEYLNGWFPKLGSWCGKIIYIDTHAGKGKHKGGQEGSPLVALKTFLEHTYRDRILTNCEVVFIFIEWSEKNTKSLKKEIESLGKLPKNVSYNIYNQNAFELLTNLTSQFEETKSNLAPCFMFIDPYGFKIPCDILTRIKAHSRSEMLITLIWRELDMVMQQKKPTQGLVNTINSIFGGEEWQEIKSINNSDERGERTIQLLKGKIGAKWATYIRMLGDNKKTRYFLLHLTDHDAGRDLMKETVWKCCPENGYYARKKDDPNQEYLIKPEPDLKRLEGWLFDKLSKKPQTWNELAESLREEIWLNKHLWMVIRAQKDKQIYASNYQGRFSQKVNPTFSLD
ncbi:MAG: three-Cys-motif partner protein TcmP [Planctomycetota bacterium]|jgi:three-Cys-motif partner protein